jgi:alditol oxidase
MTERNWAGNFAYRARRVHHPATLGELREVVTRAGSLRVLGSRHSFNAIGDADELVSLRALPADLEIAGATVSFGAGLTYGELAVELDRRGLALHNLASLPHISVAGAIATATHGSGDANGNLATAVAALELLRSDGEVVSIRRGDADFEGAVVHLGALGVVTRITLDVQPAFELRQRVFEGLSWDALGEHFDAVTGAGYSVSIVTRFGSTLDSVWVKSRDDVGELFDARPATAERHVIIGLDPASTTPQLGVPGPWWERLPHFRMGFQPSNGEEIQSEYLVPRERALDALAALRGIGEVLRGVLQVCEIRTIAADRLWMSPMYERDTVAFHFTWVRDQAAVEAALVHVEAALDGRPHLGKVFLHAQRLPRADDFLALAERYDPRGAFRDEWLTAALGPPSGR